MAELKKRFLKERGEKKHTNCVHNCRCVQRRLDFHYCSLKTETKAKTIDRLFLCEDDGWVKNCPEFKNRQSLADAEEAFNTIIRSPSRCGQVFPHLAALIWVLSDGTERAQDRQDEGILSRVWRAVLSGFRSADEHDARRGTADQAK